MNRNKKISHLEFLLNGPQTNYADSFKEDVLVFLGDLNEDNCYLDFLEKLSTEQQIENWVDKLTSRIVMKEHLSGIDEIIIDYIELG